MDTRSMSSSPLVKSLVKNQLFKTAPDIYDPPFQLIHTMNLSVVDSMLHDSTDLVIHRTEIWAVWRPQVKRKGLTENDGHENDGPSKLQDMKLQDMKMTDQVAWREIGGHEIARHEIAGRENAGHEIARHEIAGRGNAGHEIAKHETGGQTTEK